MTLIRFTKKRYRRKVSKIGNSVGITIPTELIKANGISQDDEFEWGVTANGDVFAKTVPSEIAEVLSKYREKID